MPSMSELWEKMEDGDIAKTTGSTSFKIQRLRGDLFYTASGSRISSGQIFDHDWELVKKEEKEIETERWMRDDKYIYPQLSFKNARSDTNYTPSEVMDNKSFLRWVGTMPDGSAWPGSLWSLWVNENRDWWSFYNPGDGFTIQVFAEYAEMRVQK